jgi:PilZ domain-containing protein
MRREQRKATFLRAKVRSLHLGDTYDCFTLDVSRGGVRLYVSGQALPKEFTMFLPAKGQTFRCAMVRQDGDCVGAKIVSEIEAEVNAYISGLKEDVAA